MSASMDSIYDSEGKGEDDASERLDNVDPKTTWNVDTTKFRLHWQRGWPSRTLSCDKPTFFDILHVARIHEGGQHWHLDEREIILSFLSVRDVGAFDTAISCKKERKILYESAYPGWNGGWLSMGAAHVKIESVFWLIKRRVADKCIRFIDYKPLPDDPSSPGLEEYVLAMNHPDDMEKIYARVNPVASKYLGGEFDTVPKLMRAAMKGAIDNHYAGGKYGEDSGVDVDYIPAPSAEKKVIRTLIDERQTLLYRCTKDCNVEGVRFCIEAGASATNNSLNEQTVPESPLYFLAGEGSLFFPPLDRARMFNMLIAAAISENIEAGYDRRLTSIWAHGTAEVDDSNYYTDKLYLAEKDEEGDDFSEDNDEEFDGMTVKVDKRHRRWTVLHQAAYWGHKDLVDIIIHNLDGNLGDQYLYHVQEEEPDDFESEDEDGNEGRRKGSFRLELNFGKFTPLHAAVMHLFSKKVMKVLSDEEERRDTTIEMVQTLLEYNNIADDELADRLEAQHKEGCEKCKSALEHPYEVGEKNLEDICEYYVDSEVKLLKYRYRTSAQSCKNQTPADIALLKCGVEDAADPNLMSLFDPTFDACSQHFCIETAFWEQKDIDYDQIRAIERIDDDDYLDYKVEKSTNTDEETNPAGIEESDEEEEPALSQQIEV